MYNTEQNTLIHAQVRLAQETSLRAQRDITVLSVEYDTVAYI